GALPASVPSRSRPSLAAFFFCHDSAPTEIYTLSLTRRSSDLVTFAASRIARSLRHAVDRCSWGAGASPAVRKVSRKAASPPAERSEEHTSELQSRENLVCRLLLEKKKKSREEVNSGRDAHQRG